MSIGYNEGIVSLVARGNLEVECQAVDSWWLAMTGSCIPACVPEPSTPAAAAGGSRYLFIREGISGIWKIWSTQGFKLPLARRNLHTFVGNSPPMRQSCVDLLFPRVPFSYRPHFSWEPLQLLQRIYLLTRSLLEVHEYLTSVSSLDAR